MTEKKSSRATPGSTAAGKIKPAKLHPLIASFEANSTSFLGDMRNGSGGPIADALVRLSDALHDKSDGRDALAMVRAMDLSGCDPALAVLMLQAWAKLALHLGRPAECATVLKRASLLLSPDTPPGLRAAFRFAEAVQASNHGRVKVYGEALTDILASLPKSSPHYAHYLLNLGLHLAQVGRASEFREQLDQLAREQVRTASMINRIRFMDALECCRMEEAGRLMPLAVRDGAQLVGYDRVYEALFDVLRDSLARPTSLPGPVHPGPAPGWTLVVGCLFRRQPAQALELARAQAANFPRKAISDTRFDAFNLIRAELANSHGEAARRLVAMRREVGNPHHLDDLFLARADLLAGDRPAAARRFAAVEAECRRFDSGARIDFELQLACELTPRDVAFLLGAGHATTKAQGRSAPKPGDAPDPAAPSGTSPVGTSRLVGRSQAMGHIRETVRQLAVSDLPVLITGETGTGKEVVARALHEASPRAARPLVTVNCGAIPDSLLESELFGHARGAFTGADRAAQGLFLEAGDGAILLDEIGEISPRLQVALLRVLESGEVRPVGASRAQRIRCRVLASTNADLSGAVEEGRFRRDLFYRLKRLILHIPPLRERREDIVPLAHHFLNEGRLGGEVATMEPELEEELRRRNWPGNARELRNEIERLRLLNSDGPHYSLANWRRSSAEEPGQPQARAEDAGHRSGAAEPGAPAGSATAPAPAPVPAMPDVTGGPAEVAALLRNGRIQFRRLDRLRELFRQHGKLSRTEAARVLGVSLRTATMDLKALRKEGLVDKVTPTASPRTHYFTLRGASTSEA